MVSGHQWPSEIIKGHRAHDQWSSKRLTLGRVPADRDINQMSSSIIINHHWSSVRPRTNIPKGRRTDDGGVRGRRIDDGGVRGRRGQARYLSMQRSASPAALLVSNETRATGEVRPPPLVTMALKTATRAFQCRREHTSEYRMSEHPNDARREVSVSNFVA